VVTVDTHIGATTYMLPTCYKVVAVDHAGDYLLARNVDRVRAVTIAAEAADQFPTVYAHGVHGTVVAYRYGHMQGHQRPVRKRRRR
jgi:hypothetical protein